MRVFVSEYVCGGGWPEPEISGSLATEGRAMLHAIVDDLSRIAGVDVETTWDARLGAPPFRNARAARVTSNADELQRFTRLAAECDATLVIAPELDGTLHARCELVESLGGRLLGPRSRAVSLCADKLRLAEHLRGAGVSTIPTCTLERAESSQGRGAVAGFEFPFVVKPRYGAGSQNTRLIVNQIELDAFRHELVDADFAGASASGERQSPGESACQPVPDLIFQPFIPGSPYSVALLISDSGREIEVLPAAAQILSCDGRFNYLGGRVPCCTADPSALQRVALSACQTVPGLRGYVGVDLIVPEDRPEKPIVVEINPRLTTSYLGYRALAAENLAEWLLLPSRFQRRVEWRPGSVEFTACGKCRIA